jgi:hypothetical protein
MRTNRTYLALAGFCCLAIIAMSGCTLYFDDDEDDYYCDDPWEDCSERPPTNPGFSCDSDADCAAGCYCTENTPNDGIYGICVESGYCGDDDDCGSGMHCDEGTCKPDERGCTADDQCPAGTTCDEAFGVCVPTNACDMECPVGTACDPRTRACVPIACDADSECPPGSVCNEETHRCEPSSECTADDQCPEGSYCDETRGTCTPGTDPNAPACGGTVTCNQGPPRCAANQVPLIDPTTGCYTGTCVAYQECTSEPACEVLNTAQACNAFGCEQLTVGRDCTRPDGSTCRDGDVNCTCARNEFAACLTP